MFDLMNSVLILLFTLFWSIIKWKWPMQAPKMIYFYGLMQCIKTNLSIRDQLPSWATSNDKTNDNDNIFTTLVVCHCGNYNTMISTYLIQIPMFLISYYTQLIKQQDLWWDPFKHTPLDTDKLREEFITSRLVIMLIFIVLTTSHHYLTQLDMSIIVIEKIMIQ